MKTIRNRLLLFLGAVLLLFGAFPLTAAAEEGSPVLVTYTFTDDAPVVNVSDIFLPIYEEKQDIKIAGERVEWTFFYENIFRSTEKWRDFSSSVSMLPLDASDADDGLKNALSVEQAYLLDFRDGDVYPGTASLAVFLGDVLDGDKSYSVYETVRSEDNGISLRPIADGLRLSGEGKVSFTLTEAHDMLFIETSDTVQTAVSDFLYVPAIAETDDGGFEDADIGWTIFFTVVGVILAVLVLYIITVRIWKKKRAGDKHKRKALPEKNR
ncbi:MAG: hypothetical protein ACI3XM_05670 [Eubacteriales bacterium]